MGTQICHLNYLQFWTQDHKVQITIQLQSIYTSSVKCVWDLPTVNALATIKWSGSKHLKDLPVGYFYLLKGASSKRLSLNTSFLLQGKWVGGTYSEKLPVSQDLKHTPKAYKISVQFVIWTFFSEGYCLTHFPLSPPWKLLWKIPGYYLEHGSRRVWTCWLMYIYKINIYFYIFLY